LLPQIERRLDGALSARRDIAVLIERGTALDLREGAHLASGLASLIAPRLRRVGGLVATGGETARSLLEVAGITGIRLGGEVEPGVPWGTTAGGVELTVVTKAGAFGDEATLLRCRDLLGGPAAGYANHAPSARSARRAP
jgi:uncharacterized protein YgbK (DUF1537 family)